MLQLFKNQLITNVCQKHVELRQLELDWYTNNFWTLSQQSALLAGFAFSQLCTPFSQDVPLTLQCPYLILTGAALGLQLCVLISATFCCIWGPGLALKGPNGSNSVHQAIDNLRYEQNVAFGFFVLGLVAFLGSNVLLAWTYYVAWVASFASLILGGFGIATICFIAVTTAQLRVPDENAVTGRVHALHRYERVVDLDEMIATDDNRNSPTLP